MCQNISQRLFIHAASLDQETPFLIKNEKGNEKCYTTEKNQQQQPRKYETNPHSNTPYFILKEE